MKNILFFISIFGSINSFARWATFAEAPYVEKVAEIKNTVHASGAYETTYYRMIEIKNEKGRNSQGLFRFTFNPLAETLDSIEAKTINGDSVFKVKKSDIVIKPLSHPGPGFDTQNQVSIAYPNVEIGSKLELSYHVNHTKAQVPGFFHDHFTLGHRAAVENFHEVWESDAPLFVDVADPKNYLKVEHTENRIEITLTKPIFTEIVEEKDVIESADSLLWVGISNIEKWSDFPKETIEAYETVINSPLPEKLKNIMEKAKDVGNPIDQINQVTSQLAENLRYLGDWRLVKGAYHPRTLEQIATSGYGDCKDMSVSTASILKKLGYTTHAVFISRTKELIESPIQIAALFFNHAIVWAKKDGKEYWVDPTNFTSSVQRIFPDIADRKAVILDPAGAREARTPAIDSASDIIKVDLTLNFKSNSELAGEGRVQLLGFGAESMTGEALSNSKAHNDHRLITWASRVDDLKEWKFDDYDLTSRIVKDFATNFSFKAGWQPITTSAGAGYLVSVMRTIAAIDVPLTERESSLQLSEPYQWIRNVKFSGKETILNEKINCDANTKWFDYKREVVKDGDDLLLKDFFALKTAVIAHKDLKSPQFASAQKDILTCMGDFAAVFKK